MSDWWKRNRPFFGGALIGTPFAFFMGGPDLKEAVILATVTPVLTLCLVLGVDLLVPRK